MSLVQRLHLVLMLGIPTMQWSFGVTCWEVFSLGKNPYPGVDPFSLLRYLEGRQRLDKPLNAACSLEMYGDLCTVYILPLSLITTVSQSSLAISILRHFICIRQIFVFTFHSVYILAEVIGFSIILCLGVGSSCSLFSSCGTPIFSLFTIS